MDLEYEILKTSIFNERFGSFASCEDAWQGVPQEFLEMCAATEYINCPPNEDRMLYYWPNLEAQMYVGRCVRVSSFCFARLKTHADKCPLCGSSLLSDEQAISRIDNSTIICSTCGTSEALAEFSGRIDG